MSVHDITINRDEAELIIYVLEANFLLGLRAMNDGMGMDVSDIIREKFGMLEAPDYKYRSCGDLIDPIREQLSERLNASPQITLNAKE